MTIGSALDTVRKTACTRVGCETDPPKAEIRRKFPLGAVRTTRGCVVPAARFLSALTWVAVASAGLAAVQETPGRLLEPRGALPPEVAKAPLLVTRLPAQQRASGVPAPARAPQRAFLDRYCARCHGGRRQVAGLALDRVDLDNVGANAELWERVVRKLRVGVMPPFGQPRPDAAARDAFVSWAEDAVDRAAAATPNVSRPFIHRLNRLEYANAVRDLLALEIDGRSLLPADESAHGFDNIAAVLTVGPALLERYLLAAKEVSRLAIGAAGNRGDRTYDIPLALSQDGRMSEDLPFGTRGGVSIRHHFPLAGTYVISAGLRRQVIGLGGDIRGLDPNEQIDFFLDGVRIQSFDLADERFELSRTRRRGVTGSLEGTDDRDALLQVRIPVSAGTHQVGVAFAPASNWYVEGVGPSRLPLASYSYNTGIDTSVEHGRIRSGISRLRIAGPFAANLRADSPSRRRVFVCYPTDAAGEGPCAREILSGLARRAYRRPLADGDLDELMAFYRAGRADGDFEAGVRRGLERILTDVEFLYRIERTPRDAAAGEVYRISDMELASRLSFLLWSSIPDDRLFDLADAGMLQDPTVLEQEVRRMLADPRSAAFATSFFGQWLNTRNLEAAVPDVNVFPEFDENLRAAFRQETELFLESQLREDRSALELLSADYTFVNERLARHYGIPGVNGSHFRRIEPLDERRRGLLGQGSVLTITSYAHRTSPVLRGKWVLENLLGVPPPAPPPDVPPFPEADEASEPRSIRERLERHRQNAVCASCHAQVDPLGFALEHFDGIGGWRDTDGGRPVDASGDFVGQARFDGPAGLRRLLLRHREEFVRTLTEKLLTYALGRGVEHADMPVVRSIVRDAAPTGYRWSSLILGVVDSPSFQLRRFEP